MSESKLVMARKLCNVQKSLMGKSFEDLSLQTILPIIFEECIKENLTFWFNFIEGSCVLNLRDTRFDNYELNIRQYIGNIKFSDINDIKAEVFINAFLIVPHEHNVASSQTEENTITETVKEEAIEESNMVPPSAIRVAILECKQNGEPINKKNLESKLNLKGMSKDKRRQCIAYLKSMGE